jgi:hypothetical protein
MKKLHIALASMALAILAIALIKDLVISDSPPTTIPQAEESRGSDVPRTSTSPVLVERGSPESAQLIISITDSIGTPIEGAGVWLAKNARRSLRMSMAVARTDPKGCAIIGDAFRRSNNRQRLLLAAHGYESVTTEELDLLHDGSVFRLASVRATKWLVSCDSHPLPGAQVFASESEMSHSDFSEASGELSSGLVGSIYEDSTDQDGVAELFLHEGRNYWVSIRKRGYMLKSGDPGRHVGGTVPGPAVMEKVVCVHAVVEKDEVVTVSSRGLHVPAQCAVALQQIQTEMVDDAVEQSSVCIAWLSQGDEPESLDVVLNLAKQGEFKARLRVQKIVDGVAIERIAFAAARERPTAKVNFTLKGGGGDRESAYARLPLVLVPALKQDMGNGKVFTPGATLELPYGVFQIGSILPVVRDAIDNASVQVCVAEGVKDHVIGFSDILRPVTFRIKDDAGHPIFRASVLCKRLDMPDKNQISQGVHDLPNMVFWMTDGVWEVELRPVGRPVRRFILEFPRDWKVTEDDKMVVADMR